MQRRTRPSSVPILPHVSLLSRYFQKDLLIRCSQERFDRKIDSTLTSETLLLDVRYVVSNVVSSLPAVSAVTQTR